MYKKITHTIVEEHFDHPMAKQIKSRIERPQLPTTEIFDATTFRNNVAAAGQQYASNLNSVIDKYNSSPLDVILAFEQASSTVDSLGNMTKPFMTSELGERINLQLRMILMYSTLMIQGARSNQDISPFSGRITNAANELAFAMQSYNFDWGQFSPDGSPANYVLPILTDISQTINSKVQAKVAGNESTANDLSTKLATDFNNFSTAISESIIKRYPDRFTTMATAWAGCPTPAPTPAPM
jgi:hypothetical protein